MDGKGEGPAFFFRLQTVEKGVFHQRLKRKQRHTEGQTAGIHIAAILNPVPIEQLLDGDIFRDIVHLFPERGEGVIFLETTAEKGRQGEYGLGRLIAAFQDGQLADSVEGVEQKMGVDLRLKGLELRLAEQFFGVKLHLLLAHEFQPFLVEFSLHAVAQAGLGNVASGDRQEVCDVHNTLAV